MRQFWCVAMLSWRKHLTTIMKIVVSVVEEITNCNMDVRLCYSSLLCTTAANANGKGVPLTSGAIKSVTFSSNHR